jgi:hypothetical protein
VTRARAARTRRRAAPASAADAAAWRLHAPASLALGFAAFFAAGLLAYGPALRGEFVSDDQHYVRDNAYLHELSLENLREILDPTSVLVIVVENYAPVHLLLNALQWQVFGTHTTGYHVVNVAFHALASLLLVLLFARVGVPPPAALAGGAVFLLHPLNVEAVAWIAQLKSPSALALAVAALLAHPRRPLLAAVLFGLALLAKPSALFALPVAVVLTWTDPAARRRDWAWLGAWLAVFAGFAAVEVPAFGRTAARAAVVFADFGEQLRTTVAIALRYLALLLTTRGLSTFHEPAFARTWTDPWWLGGLAALGLVGARSALVLWRRRPEAAFWVWAAASYAAVCNLVLPLPFPMADRYMYFILPGLIGAVLLAGGGAVRALRARAAARGVDADRAARSAARACAVAALAVLLALGARTHARARVFRNAEFMMADAELHYPDGVAAKTRQATRAARRGDADAAIEALRAAHARGYNRLDHLLNEPAYQALRSDPRFQALLVEVADEQLAYLARNDTPSQLELHLAALAHLVRGDTAAAVGALERALEVGGPIDEQIRRDLDAVRARLRRERAAERAASEAP